MFRHLSTTRSKSICVEGQRDIFHQQKPISFPTYKNATHPSLMMYFTSFCDEGRERAKRLLLLFSILQLATSGFRDDDTELGSYIQEWGEEINEKVGER